MKKTFKFLLILSMFSLLAPAAKAQTAQDIFNKAAAKIKGASSVTADFKMNISGRACNGKLVAKGNKFAMTSNVGSSWYNGSDMYSYNPSSGETTVMKPSASELMEANPLMYARSSENYTASFSKQKTAGKHTLYLVPKKKNSGLKNVMMVLNASTFLPEKIVVTPTSGSAITVNVSNLNLNATVSDSQFNYPKSKYPKAKIIDLR